MIKQGRVPPIPAAVQQEEEVVANASQSPFQDASPEERTRVKDIENNILTYVYRDGYEDVLEELEKGRDNLPETVGAISGNLLNTEMTMEDEEGRDVDPELALDLGSTIVEQITDIAEREPVNSDRKFVKFKDDEEAQIFMGEALTYALSSTVEGDNPFVTRESWMELTQNMLTDGTLNKPPPVSGVRVPPEVG
jgi:hypothetical protein